MEFTNKDLKQLKANPYRPFKIIQLIARLEASERVNEKMGCGCCADYDELQEAKLEWRKASGNLYSDEKPKYKKVKK
jgi:hypothetical protein